MFIHTEVMSQREAEKYCTLSHDCDSVIISISNSFDLNAKLYKTKQNGVVDILRLSFDDVFKSELHQNPNMPFWFDRFGRLVNPIKEEDCKKIYDFIMNYHNKQNEYHLIVHCEMGVSRSSAVMAAIHKALYNDDFVFFNSAKYRPNPDVYRMVLNYFMEHN